LRATISNMMDATCARPLKVRSFLRMEIEELPVTSSRCARRMVSYAPDYLPSNSLEPWGRNLAYDVTGSAVGDFVQQTFVLPSAGTFQSCYFIGRTNTGAIIRTSIDDSLDLSSYDSYYGPVGWRWTRSDTLRGNIISLAAGTHTIRFEIAGRNPASTGWKMIVDQMLLQRSDSGATTQPRAVGNLAASVASNGLRLCWSPVREDTAGHLVTPTTYNVYRAASLGGSLELIGLVAGTDTTFTDTTLFAPASQQAYYFVTARIGARGLIVRQSASDIVIPKAASVRPDH
jgi:hypothetical protein